MTDTPSRMLCPTCEEQPLETLRIAQGELQRCTNCLFFWIELKALAAMSDDRSQFLALIDESKALLLPTARFCPVCYQKLHHGRIKSRQIILTICPVCQALWIDFPMLNQLDPVLERTLKTALEQGPPSPQASGVPSAGPAETVRKPRTPSADDTGVGRLFRGVANVFDKMADRASGDSPAKPADEKKKPAPAKPVQKKPGKATPATPASQPPPEPPIPEPEVPDTTSVEAEAAIAEQPIEPTIPAAVPTPAAPPAQPASVEAPIPAALETPVLEDSLEPAIIEPTPAKAPEPATLTVSPEPTTPAAIPVEEKPAAEPAPSPVVERPEITLEPMPTFSPLPAEPQKVVNVEPVPTPVAPPKQEAPKTKEPLIVSRLPDLQPPATDEPVRPSVDDVHRELIEQTAPKPKTGKSKTEPMKPPTKAPALPQPKPKPGIGSKIAAFFKPSKTRIKPAAAPAKMPVAPPEKKVAPVPVAAEAPTAVPPLSIETPATVVSEKPETQDVPQTQAVPETPAPEPTPEPIEPEAQPQESSVIAEESAAPVTEPEAIETPEEIVEPLVPEPEPVIVEAERVVHPERVPPKPVPIAAEVVAKASRNFAAPKPHAVAEIRRPSTPFVDRLAGWLPRVLPVLAFLLNLTKGPDFDFAEAVVWALLVWAGALAFRLYRMYPFKKPFVPLSVQELLKRPTSSRWKGDPVQLTGRLIDGKIMMLADESGSVPLDVHGPTDILPRFFGISNLAKFPKEDVVIDGWLRGSPTPYVEIGDIRSGKVFRKALVRALRWGIVVVVVLISSLVLLSD